MTLPQFDAVFFDLDGTLIDTETVALRTGMAAFAEVGFPVDHAFMARLVGVDLPTAAGIIGAALPGIDRAVSEPRVSSTMKRHRRVT